jgi:hypothetical protein
MQMPSIVMGKPPPRLEPNTEASAIMCTLLIPDYDPEDPKPYPSDIQLGEYQCNEIVELLRQHSANLEGISFIADMLKELDHDHSNSGVRWRRRDVGAGHIWLPGREGAPLRLQPHDPGLLSHAVPLLRCPGQDPR